MGKDDGLATQSETAKSVNNQSANPYLVEYRAYAKRQKHYGYPAVSFKTWKATQEKYYRVWK